VDIAATCNSELGRVSVVIRITGARRTGNPIKYTVLFVLFVTETSVFAQTAMTGAFGSGGGGGSKGVQATMLNTRTRAAKIRFDMGST